MKKNERIPAAKVAVALALLSALNAALAQGIEAPPLVIRSNTQESTIWAQDRVGAPAANGAQSIQSTTGAGAAMGTVNATGANTVLSTTQVAQPASVVVAGDAPCESEPKTWDGSCQATLPRTFSGQAVTATADAPQVGSATFACQAGAWQPPTAVTCQSYCAPATVTWSSCSATAASQMEGQNQAVTNVVTGFNGSATFTCSAGGTFTYVSGTCAATPPPVQYVYAASICTSQGRHHGHCGGWELLCSYVPPTPGPYAVALRLTGGGGNPGVDGAQECRARLLGTPYRSRHHDVNHQQWSIGHSANGQAACNCVSGGSSWTGSRATR